MTYDMHGENNPFYGKRHTKEAREKMRNARLNTGNGKGYTKTYGKHTHRIVAEQMLGRPLRRDEIVHHKDGNKQNNNPSNLEVMTQSEHARLHFIKPVRCIETGIVYDSVIDAANAMGVNKMGIYAVCNGYQKSSHGYHWEHVERG